MTAYEVPELSGFAESAVNNDVEGKPTRKNLQSLLGVKAEIVSVPEEFARANVKSLPELFYAKCWDGTDSPKLFFYDDIASCKATKNRTERKLLYRCVGVNGKYDFKEILEWNRYHIHQVKEEELDFEERRKVNCWKERVRDG